MLRSCTVARTQVTPGGACDCTTATSRAVCRQVYGEFEVQTATGSDTVASGGTAATAGRLPVRLVNAMCWEPLSFRCSDDSHVGARRVGRGLLNRQGVRPIEAAKPPRKSPHRGGNLINGCVGRYAGGHRETNGRPEATQVDVAAKYPGRLATLTVNEGDRSWPDRWLEPFVAGNRSPVARRPSAGAQSKTGVGRS